MLNTAVASSPSSADAQLARVAALLELRRYDELIASCDAMLKQGLASADMYVIRGHGRVGREDFPAAIEDYTPALAANPSLLPRYS